MISKLVFVEENNEQKAKKISFFYIKNIVQHNKPIPSNNTMTIIALSLDSIMTYTRHIYTTNM